MNGTEERRVLTSQDGSFELRDARPGVWRIIVPSVQLPTMHLVEGDSVRTVDLPVGTSTNVDVRILPRQRKVLPLDAVPGTPAVIPPSVALPPIARPAAAAEKPSAPAPVAVALVAAAALPTPNPNAAPKSPNAPAIRPTKKPVVRPAPPTVQKPVMPNQAAVPTLPFPTLSQSFSPFAIQAPINAACPFSGALTVAATCRR
jgi:hypothetical protein